MVRSEETSLHEIMEALNQREAETLSSLATLSRDGVRRCPEKYLDTGYRQSFAADVDRVLHSHAYTRYIDKTQVFYLIHNDHITHRVLHVQLVSKIGRTIGRFLGINEDLIEAIALGHDIGHAPFGHDGERFLSDLCRQNSIGYFQHNVQSLQFLEKVERKGKGWNLCLQTLDGILCHDGEVHNETLEPCREKTFEDLERDMARKRAEPETELVPMTLEGCVVRMADTISYIGRDIEDAIRLNLIRREDLPKKSVERLGNTNGTIVYYLVTDIIQNSYGKRYIALSPDVSDALKRLKDFNLNRIYLNQKIKKHLGVIQTLFEMLFERYLNDISQQNRESVIFTRFLEGMAPEYIGNHGHAEIIRDFISGMTDHYFLRQFPKHMRPEPIVYP